MDEILSDLVARVQKLEQTPAPKPGTVVSSGSEKHFFPTKITLVSASPTAVTAWADSGSGKYIPDDAKEAIVFASIDDTQGGTGESRIESYANGIQLPLALLYEQIDTVGMSASGQSYVPITGGRFDWRLAAFPAGAAAVVVRIFLLGYVK